MKQKNYFLLLGVVLSLLMTTGCKRVETPAYNSFIGKWEVVAIYVNGGNTNMLNMGLLMEPCLKNNSLEFFSDMTFEMISDCNWMADKGTYTFTDDIITANGESETQTFSFKDGILSKEVEAGGYTFDLRFKKREEKSRYDITIEVLDLQGNSLANLVPSFYSLLTSVASGGTVTIQAPALEGYVVDEQQTSSTRVLENVYVDQTVTFIYREADKAIVTINLFDEANQVITAPDGYSVSRTVTVGASITIEAATIDGYDLVSTSPVVLNNVGADTTVTFNYKIACGDPTPLVGTWKLTSVMNGSTDWTSFAQLMYPTILNTTATFQAPDVVSLVSPVDEFPSETGTFCTNGNDVVVTSASGTKTFTITSPTTLSVDLSLSGMALTLIFTKQ